MSLIDKEYFFGQIDIPNIDEQINTFNDLLDQYEKEILTDLLGYDLYKAFAAALSAASNDPDNLLSPWRELVKGGEFTFEFDGHTITDYWNGLINTEKISLLAYYSYFNLRFKDLSFVTGVNEAQGISENAVTVTSTRKMVYAWNEFLRLYGETRYQINGRDVYPTDRFYFDKHSSDYDTYNDQPSAFNYLNANRATFEAEITPAKWKFTPKLRRNNFGL